MANYGQPGYGAPGGQYPGQGYGGAPAPGQQPYGAPPGQQPYGAPPPGQYGAPPPGQPGAPGYGAAPPPGQPGYGAPGTSYQPQGGWGAPQGIDPQVAQWFQSVDTDRSGRITALELQQALVNGNWSNFNPETCRLMIGLFDRDHTGTIEINEFSALWNYIQQWKGVFERFDTNRSGQIEANELGQAVFCGCTAQFVWDLVGNPEDRFSHNEAHFPALQQMGYNLSPQFHQMIVARFDVRARRSITLDNFIQVCVMVKSLTDMFRQRDTAMTGTIKITYEDFMQMCILNKP